MSPIANCVLWFLGPKSYGKSYGLDSPEMLRGYKGDDGMSYETILYETKGPIAYITLNRPRVLNAYNDTMGDELLQAHRAFDQDDDLHVLIISGAGRAFCSGADVRQRQLRPLAGVYGEKKLEWGQILVPQGLQRSSTVLPNCSAKGLKLRATNSSSCSGLRWVSTRCAAPLAYTTRASCMPRRRSSRKSTPRTTCLSWSRSKTIRINSRARKQ